MNRRKGPVFYGKLKTNTLSKYQFVRRRENMCGCGYCKECLSNANWQKRFEKHVDQHYYKSESNQKGRSPITSAYHEEN